VWSVSFGSGDATRLVSGSHDRTLKLWTFPPEGIVLKLTAAQEVPAGGEVWSVAVSPRGDLIAVGLNDGTLDSGTSPKGNGSARSNTNTASLVDVAFFRRRREARHVVARRLGDRLGRRPDHLVARLFSAAAPGFREFRRKVRKLRPLGHYYRSVVSGLLVFESRTGSPPMFSGSWFRRSLWLAPSIGLALSVGLVGSDVIRRPRKEAPATDELRPDAIVKPKKRGFQYVAKPAACDSALRPAKPCVLTSASRWRSKSGPPSAIRDSRLSR